MYRILLAISCVALEQYVQELFVMSLMVRLVFWWARNKSWDKKPNSYCAEVFFALSIENVILGIRNDAKTPIITITINISINVNELDNFFLFIGLD